MTYKIDKRLLIGGGLFILVGYLVATILRVLTPVTPEIPTSNLVVTNLDKTTTTFQNVRFVGRDQPSIPAEFGVFQATIVETSDQLLMDLQSTLSLTPATTVKNLYLSSEFSLSTAQPTQWLLSKQAALPSIEVVNLETAITVASNFNNRYLKKTLTAYRGGIEYFEATQTEFDESTADRANLVSIPFAPTVDGYPVFIQNQDSYPAVFYITSDPYVLRAEFNPTQILLGSKTLDLPALTVNQAVENINNNQGAIIHAGQNEFGDMDLTQIVNADLTSVSIEYRVDPELNLAYPFYRFKGTAKNTAGNDLEVEIITPAVATKSR